VRKINENYLLYSQNPTKEAFEQLYLAAENLVKTVSNNFAKSSKVPVEEFLSLLAFEVWKSTKTFDKTKGTEYSTWLRTRLNQQAIAVTKGKENTYRRRVEVMDTTDENAPTFEVGDELNLEDFVLNKKEADQRQLIDFLTDPTKVDATTTKIVEAFPQYKSITALAKALGLHHMLVRRKLESLIKNYDESAFGDYRDYLYAG
jgi:DNA-directed RNA polymerase specialized sigma24 family protein